MGAGLGHIEVDVGVGSPSGERLVRVRALASTRATFTVIPEGIAKELGLLRGLVSVFSTMPSP